MVASLPLNLAVDLDPALLDVFQHQLEYVHHLEFFESLGEPFLQTKPGRVKCVASLG
jgi:hypothetical protein